MRVATFAYSLFRRIAGEPEHLDQSALAARLPFVGRRVPMKEYWRRQPIDPGRALDRGAAAMKRRATQSREFVAKAAPARARRAATSRLGVAITAAVAAATLMYYLDPSTGRRRRARVRDRFAHLRRVFTRDVPEKIERRGRFFGGIAKGVRHNASEILPHKHTHVDDETLVARVRSEVLRNTEIKAGEIHVDAYEGCITLRGQLEDPADIDRMVERVRRVDGVSEVRSYLHLPGTPSPNKAESYNGHVPAHMAQ